MKYFVWITGLKGPEAQIWDEKSKTEGQKPIKTLFAVEISDRATLAECIALYPFEAKL